MNKKFTFLFLVFLAFISAKATYVPVPLTGFNVDVVANGVGAPNTTTTAALDDASATTGFVFCAEDYNYDGTCTPITAPYFLPNTGLVTSPITSGLSYQLGSYSGNNCLRLLSGANTGTVNFVTPIAAGELFLLITSGAGQSTVDVTVTFTDNSTQAFTGVTVYDWYTTNAQVIKAARVSRIKTTCGNDGNPASDNGPKLYQVMLTIATANLSKSIGSITVTRTNTSTTYVNLMGISINTPCTAPFDQPFGLSMTPTTSQISGSFTGAFSNPDGYLVVRYPFGGTPVSPVDGTLYTPGANLGTGTVIQTGSSTSFSSSGLFAGSFYDFYVYSYNNTGCGGGPTYNTVNPLMGTQFTLSCGGPGNVTIPVGPGQTYATLTSAINALASSGITGPVILELQSNYSSANEPSFPIVFPFNPCVSTTNKITVRPATNALNLVITSSNNGPTIDLDGASNIVFDGRPGGTNTTGLLQIINTSNSGAAIRFINDATFNTITYCDLQGQNTSLTTNNLTGVVYFSTAGVNALGNDNNTISYCNIHGTSSGTPAGCVISYGTNSSAGAYNDNCVITNCNIYDYFQAGVSTTGIKLDQGNSSWTISYNNLYQTVTRLHSGTFTHRGMHINSNSSGSSSMTPQGSGFIIEYNNIGGNGATGNYTLGGTATTTAVTFMGMDISVGVGVSTVVRNNTLKNIAFSTGTTSATTPNFVGLHVNYGNVDVKHNTIGDPLVNGSITLTRTGTSTTAGLFTGIRVAGGITNNVDTNIIAGITTVGTTTIPYSFTGIYVSGGSLLNNITGNTIGSTTIANSIQASTAGGTQIVHGIWVTGGTATNIVQNTVANIHNNGSGTGATIFGINLTSSIPTIVGNTIFGLSTQSTSTGAGASSCVLGINMTSSAVGATITGNTIYNLSNSAATANVSLIGMNIATASTGTNIVNRNLVYNVSTTSSGATAVVNGIVTNGGSADYFNNMVRLGYDNANNSISNAILIRGFVRNGGPSNNIYYNSIYVGGNVTGAGTTRTFAFQRPSISNTDNILNNIFVNSRNNVTSSGSHYAISFGPNSGTGGNAGTGANLNYNIYYANGVGGVMGYTTIDVPAYSQGWIPGDVNSFYADPLFINPNGATPDLHINTSSATYAESGGTPISGISTDFDNNIRFGNSGYTGTGAAPDIGADEFNGVAALPACSGTPTPGVATGSVTSVCPGINFALSLTGYTIATGISLQWESSPAGAYSWSPISGANSSSFITNATTSTDYRVRVTCANGNGTDTSNIVSVTINSFFNCYCTPSGGSSSYGINNFSTTGGTTNISNLGSGFSTGGYGDFTSQILTASPSTVINFAASYLGASSTYGFAIFIDYNQNGSFADAGETVFNTTAYATSASGSFTIPSTALPGNTRIRIVANFLSSNPSGQYCNTGISGEFEDYTLNIGAPPSCIAPTLSATTNIATSGATINWTASPSSPNGYDYYYSTNNTPPTVSTTPSGSVSSSTTSVNLSGLSGSTTYYFWVRSDCGTGGYSAWAQGSFATLLSNDLPSGAIPLTVNAGCSGNPFFNNGSTHAAGEPFPSCEGTSGFNTVWYKFIAPASGAVKISNDYSGGSMGDSKLALFLATDSSNFNTFNIVACDDDNGFTVGTKSIVYATGLISGTTYYVVVDGYASSTTAGTFCLTVDELNSSMLSTSASCLAGQGVSGLNSTYNGFVTLVSNDANTSLIALVKQVTGSATSYTVSQTVNTSALRQDAGQYYLDRNYLINGPTSGAYDVQFFFLNSELTALQAVDANASLSNLNVTRQSGTSCQANFSSSVGNNTALLQSMNGSANGVSFLQVSSPGFSNFYIMTGVNPLEIKLSNIDAANHGKRNRIDWNTVSENRGDKFELERSEDGTSFGKLSVMDANGSASEYSYWDDVPFDGINYYRLKLIDESGRYLYSKTVSTVVKNSLNFQIKAYPNPVKDQLSVELSGVMGDNAMLSLADLAGRVIKTFAVNDDTVIIDVKGFAQGIYMLKYSDSEGTQTMKINKQ